MCVYFKLGKIPHKKGELRSILDRLFPKYSNEDGDITQISTTRHKKRSG